nr:hypothetical protein [Ferrovum sp.]
MYSTAITAYPFSYSKVRPTFRTAVGVAPAARTDLGRESFIDFLIPRAFSNGFVREHCSESRPGCVQYGLGQPGLGQSRGIDVSHRDVIEFFDNTIRKFMQRISARIRDFCVNCFYQPFFVGALGFAKFGLQFSVMPFIGNFFSRGESGKILEPKIDPDSLFRGFRLFGRGIDHDVQKPVASPVTTEICTVLDFPVREWSGIKYPESVSGKSKGVSFAVQMAAFERNPSKGFFTAPTKERTIELFSGFCILFANRIDGAGMNIEFGRRTGGQFVEIKPGWPFLAPFKRLFLNIVAVVPDKIHCSGLAVEQSSERFDTIAIDKDHFCLFSQSSTARRINSDTESPFISESSFSSVKSWCGKKKCVRFIYTYYQPLIALSRRGNQALSLPGLNAGVSRTSR